MRVASRLAGVLVAVVLGVAADAGAIPLLSVDTDPTTAGVQASRQVLLGSAFEIDILIADVEAAQPLHAFELDLLFDGGVISVSALAGGDFLQTPTFLVQSDIGSDFVEYAEVTLGPASSGDGLLLSVVFAADALGTSVLDLQNVLLSQPFAVPLEPFLLADGIITVVDELEPPPGSAVPEPSAAWLFALGYALCARSVQRRR